MVGRAKHKALAESPFDNHRSFSASGRTQRPRNLFGGMMSFVNNNSVIVVMNRICFATSIMSAFRQTPVLSGFFDVLAEIKKKMLNLRYNL